MPKMRRLGILAIVLLFGCAPYQTMDELIADAEVTGDWTKVDQRVERLDREDAENAPRCPSNRTEICKDGRCECLTKGHLPMVIGP